MAFAPSATAAPLTLIAEHGHPSVFKPLPPRRTPDGYAQKTHITGQEPPRPEAYDNRWTNWFKQPLSPGYFGWPGCCNGGTYDNPDTGQEGIYYGVASDEWLLAHGVYSRGGVWGTHQHG